LDWLRDFQQSFREPVFAFISDYWPGLLLVGAIGISRFTSDRFAQRPADGGSSGGGFSDGDGDGGDDGGD
jgi:hypothetical protein